MIAGCEYGETGLKLRFEWPIEPDVIGQVESLRIFFDLVKGEPGVDLIKKNGAIVGLKLTYDACQELFKGRLDSVNTPGSPVEDFQRFLSTRHPGK